MGIQSIADFLGVGQNDSIEDFLTAAGLVNAAGNPLVAINSVDFVGHSLGGHLAIMAAYKYSNLVGQANTFNGAGLQGWDQIFNDLAGDLGNSTLDTERVTNYFADKGIELTSDSSLWFKRPGAYQKIFIEEGGAIENHGVDKLVESLSVYRVFGLLDPSLDTGVGLSKIYSILDSANNVGAQSLEKTIDQLGDLLGGALAVQSNKDDIELFYQGVDAHIASLGGTLAIKDVASFSDSAQLDSVEGLAYRYALVELNPFAITGNATLYDNHNAQGELDWYDPATGQGTLTTAYLNDRAELLQEMVKDNANDSDYSDAITWSDRYYHDNASGISVGAADAGKHILFSDFRSEGLAGSAGFDPMTGSGNDHLYGGAGNDTLNGKKGADYLEGGIGDDTYIYNSGSYTSGDGWDKILDVDGLGSIRWNGSALGEAKQASEDEPYLFVDQARGITFSFTENADFSTSQRGMLTITEAGKFGGIKVLNYKLSAGVGELGLNLKTTVVDEQDTDYSLSTTADMPIIGSGDVAEANGATTYAEHLTFYEADLKLTALDGQSNTLIGGAGDDLLRGGDGSDRLAPRFGKDRVEAGEGNDLISNAWGSNSVAAGEGNDIILLSTLLDTTIIDEDGMSLFLPNHAHPLDLLWTLSQVDNALYFNDSGHYIYALQVTFEDKTWTEDGVLYSTTSNAVDKVFSINYAPDAPDFHIPLGSYTVTRGVAEPDVYTVGINFEDPDFEDEPVDSRFNDLSGGAGDDLISAYDTVDYISGGAGNDLLMGHGGDDYIEGGAGNDGLIGGAGNDILEGGLGDDQLLGEDGNDQLAGGDGDDELFGDNDILPEAEHGNDTLDGGAGKDTLVGQGGNDTLLGGSGEDELYGGTGDDALRGGGDIDRLYGGDGIDRLYGDGGDDFLVGGDGGDYLFGGSGVDQLQGGDGNDVLEGGSGNDYLFGEAGVDTFVFRPGGGIDTVADADGSGYVRFEGVSRSAVFATMVAGGGQTQFVLSYGAGDEVHINDGASGISRYEFTDGQYTAAQLLAEGLEYEGDAENDSITGDSGSDIIHGYGGNDVLAGRGGDDRIVAGEGNDSLAGGTGDDVLLGQAGNDTLDGGQGDDQLQGGGGDDTFVVESLGGRDVIFDSGGFDSVQFGAGIVADDLKFIRHDDNLSISVVGTSDRVVVVDWFKSGTQGQSIEQVILDDGTQYDVNEIVALTLANQGQVIDGSGAADELLGGMGDDVLAGGFGNDRYYFNAGGGHDVIDENVQGGVSGTGVIDTGDDALIFGANITPEQLVAERVTADGVVLALSDPSEAGDLVIHVNDNDSITVRDWFVDTLYMGGVTLMPPRLEHFEFADGRVWHESQIDQWLGGEAVNYSPTVLGGIDDLRAETGVAFQYVVPASFFVDPEDEVLTFSATQSDGSPLPSWLLFDANNPTFSGTPQVDDSALLQIALTATDGQGLATTVTFKLAAGDATFVVQGTFDDDVISGGSGEDAIAGLAGEDELHGKEGDDLLLGGDGNDRIWANEGDDVVEGGAGDDVLYGRGGSDTLDGGSGDDVLGGGEGADTLIGGSGRDSLSGNEGDDRYLLNVGDGANRIIREQSSGVGVEHNLIVLEAGITPADVSLTLSGRDLVVMLTATGDQMIYEDYQTFNIPTQLYNAPSDQIAILFDNGVLWDQAEITARTVLPVVDSLVGTAGDDVFVIDTPYDTIVETEGGVDTVMTSVTYTLPDNVENLVATGNVGLNLTGNDLNNTLTGNAGSNILMGMGGSNNYVGGDGGDTYILDRGDSVSSVTELDDEGVDTVFHELTDGVESLVTLSNNIENYELTLAGGQRLRIYILSPYMGMKRITSSPCRVGGFKMGCCPTTFWREALATMCCVVAIT